MNQVVARFRNGQLVKGVTNDFLPNKDRFHVVPEGSPAGAKPVEVLFSDLKAIFFVKSLQGEPQHHKTNTFQPGVPAIGRKLNVVFQDGEVLTGTTQGYQPGRIGFFMVPADRQSNNERCFVISAATREVKLL